MSIHAQSMPAMPGVCLRTALLPCFMASCDEILGQLIAGYSLAHASTTRREAARLILWIGQAL